MSFVREKLVDLLTNSPQLDVLDWTTGWEEAANYLIAHGVTVQEWISVDDRLPEKDGQYLIFTTQYFTPDHIDEIDHKDGIEISGYCKRYGFLSKNGIHAKYWRDIPQPPKEVNDAESVD